LWAFRGCGSRGIDDLATPSCRRAANVTLADQTQLQVAGDHPVWVDGSSRLTHAGRLPASLLRPGDRLRTAGGTDAVVASLRYGTGRAVVYTLTVARDHTFFVAADRVLVHNANLCQVAVKGLGGQTIRITDAQLTHILDGHLGDFKRAFGMSTKEEVLELIVRVLR
jgi:hypothetical protein